MEVEQGRLRKIVSEGLKAEGPGGRAIQSWFDVQLFIHICLDSLILLTAHVISTSFPS